MTLGDLKARIDAVLQTSPHQRDYHLRAKMDNLTIDVDMIGIGHNALDKETTVWLHGPIHKDL